MPAPGRALPNQPWPKASGVTEPRVASACRDYAYKRRETVVLVGELVLITAGAALGASLPGAVEGGWRLWPVGLCATSAVVLSCSHRARAARAPPSRPRHDNDVVKLLSEGTGGSVYLHATATHLEASVAALQRLAERVTARDVRADAEPVHIRLAHMEHGAFLTTQLFGTNVLPFTGRTLPERDFGVYSLPPAALLSDPYAATPQEPFTYVIVANHPVAAQVETALTALAGLLARREVTDRARQGDLTRVDEAASTADEQAHRTVQDAIRSRGWEAAADALRERAIVTGRPFVVRYDRMVLEPEAVRRRVPILRHVYNAMPEARTAIDKVATVLSQTMQVMGGGTYEIGAYGRTLLDVGAMRTYLAHLARDAFVCGNGYLSFGTAPDEDLRLLRPEHTWMIGDDRAVTFEDGKEVEHGSVMHQTGARQMNGSCGLSVLEPYVMLLLHRQNAQPTLLMEQYIAEQEAPSTQELERSRASADLGRRMLAFAEEQAKTLLGGPSALEVDVPVDLYFPGHADMAPAAEAITLFDEAKPESE